MFAPMVSCNTNREPEKRQRKGHFLDNGNGLIKTQRFITIRDRSGRRANDVNMDEAKFSVFRVQCCVLLFYAAKEKGIKCLSLSWFLFEIQNTWKFASVTAGLRSSCIVPCLLAHI